MQPSFSGPRRSVTQGLTTNAGFTLFELLIALAIAAILLSVGIPSFENYIKSNSVLSLQQNLRGALVVARTEAASRNKPVGVCPSANATSCAADGNWSAGWLVFIDDGGTGGTARDGTAHSSEEVIRADLNSTDNAVVVEDSSGTALTTLSFNERGYNAAVSRVMVTVCDSDSVASRARGLIVEPTGRVMLSRDLAGGDGVHDASYVAADGTVTTTALNCTP